MQSQTGWVDVKREKASEAEDSPGIIVFDGARVAEPRPRIAAFIWGGEIKPAPTLPFGRWKGAA